ncbi:MAG TPA: hypothetical protein VGF18_10345, partial [Candidatus Tumulicola sp.]
MKRPIAIALLAGLLTACGGNAAAPSSVTPAAPAATRTASVASKSDAAIVVDPKKKCPVVSSLVLGANMA